jgi:hypothetical protein
MSRKKLVHTIPGVALLRKLAAEGDRLFTVERPRVRPLVPELPDFNTVFGELRPMITMLVS